MVLSIRGTSRGIDGSTTAQHPYRLYVSQSCASQSCEGQYGAYGCADWGSCLSGERVMRMDNASW